MKKLANVSCWYDWLWSIYITHKRIAILHVRATKVAAKAVVTICNAMMTRVYDTDTRQCSTVACKILLNHNRTGHSYLRQGGGYASDQCGLSVCQEWLSVRLTWCSNRAYQLEELINFWWWSGPGYGFRISFPLPSPLHNRDIFLTQSPAMTLCKMTDAKVMNSQRFGTDPADVQIRIWIDPEIWIKPRMTVG